MDAGASGIAVSGVAALLFALTFLVGRRIHPLQWLFRDRRSAISLGAGMSSAYVFVRLMPELQGAREAFVASASAPLRYEGMAIYFVALVGFLVFYGLDVLQGRLREDEESGRSGRGFRLHVGGFAVYVCLMAYMLVHSLETGRAATLLFALTIALHFLSVDHAMREEHGAAYDRAGRWILAGAAVAGWGAGMAVALPLAALALIVAFVAGAVIVNNTIMELPSEKDGRTVPFLVGGIGYGLILVPLG